MTPTKVSVQTVRELAATMNGVEPRRRAALKREFCAAWGISASSLSRALCEVGARCHRREDSGKRRAAVPEEKLMEIAAIQRSSLSMRKGVQMPAGRAIQIAEDSRIVEKGSVSTWFFNSWARSRQASRTDQVAAEPHTELRSLGPNHVHQVDFSVAVNWKMFDGKLQYEHLVYKNKLPSAGVPRLLRLILTDHSTGCCFAHYTLSTGETVQALLEGLYYGWTVKRLGGESIERKFPLKGVPRILMADRGSANQAGVTESLMERLGVRLNICVGARSKGSVECAQELWERSFEASFRLQPPPSVAVLNEWAVDFAARYNAERVHSRTGMTRSLAWAWFIGKRAETALREIKVDFETFKSLALSEPVRCLVNGARIVRFRGRKYRAPEEFLPREYAVVRYSPFDWPQVLMAKESAAGQETRATWLCEPVETDEFGFPVTAPVIGESFRAQKKTETARFVDVVAERAKELAADGSLRVFGHHAGEIEAVAARRDGADALASSGGAQEAEAVAYMSRVAARARVLERIGRPFTPAEAMFVNRVFGESVAETEVDAAVDAIQQGLRAAVVAMGGMR